MFEKLLNVKFLHVMMSKCMIKDYLIILLKNNNDVLPMNPGKRFLVKFKHEFRPIE